MGELSHNNSKIKRNGHDLKERPLSLSLSLGYKKQKQKGFIREEMNKGNSFGN